MNDCAMNTSLGECSFEFEEKDKILGRIGHMFLLVLYWNSYNLILQFLNGNGEKELPFLFAHSNIAFLASYCERENTKRGLFLSKEEDW